MYEPDAEDKGRFRALYDRTSPQLMSYCLRRTRQRIDALDATADTYLVAWRRFDTVPEGDAALLWLFAAARRVLANQRRASRRREKLKRRLQSVDTDLESPEDIAVANDEQRALLRALERLSDDEQELLRLATSEQLPHSDIAALRGCSRNAVDVRLHRARKHLAREFHKVNAATVGTDRHRGGARHG